MQASDFFAAEEATRERRLGNIDACRRWVGDDLSPRVCISCGKTYYTNPNKKQRYRMCDPCRQDPNKRRFKTCAVCGKQSARQFSVHDTKPYFCLAVECQRKRSTQWGKRLIRGGIVRG